MVLNQGIEHHLKLRRVDALVKGRPACARPRRRAGRGDAAHARGRVDAVVVDYGAADASRARGRYGILTERDVTRLVAQRTADRALGELASRPLVTCRADDSLYRVRMLLAERHIRHIGVLDAEGELVDLVSFKATSSAAWSWRTCMSCTTPCARATSR